MSRTVATVWHASLSAFAALLYFLFVLPRWWELTGFAPHVLGTVLRIVLGVLIAVTALPVAATLKRARRPEFGTPQLALTLLTGSIAAHVVAGTLIAGTAISEIWLSLDNAGVWLFGIYGAAAAIALLGIGAYYLSFIAELPPPPPKPIKPKTEKQRRWWEKKAGAAAGEESDETEESEESEDGNEDEDEDEDAGESEDEDDDSARDESEPDDETVETGAQEKLRPSGKRRAKEDK